MVRQLRHPVPSDHFAEALTGPWNGEPLLPVLGWGCPRQANLGVSWAAASDWAHRAARSTFVNVVSARSEDLGAIAADRRT